MQKPITTPRQDWEKEFKQMYQSGDGNLLIPSVFEDESLENCK